MPFLVDPYHRSSMPRLLSYWCAIAGIAAFCFSTRFMSRAQEDDAVMIEERPRTFEEARQFCGHQHYLMTLAFRSDVETAVRLHEASDEPVFWLNMKVLGGFYHWLDPMPGLVLDLPWKPGTDWGNALSASGQGIGNWNITHNCAVLNVSARQINTIDCEEKFPFACLPWLPYADMSDAQVIVSLTSNRPPILLSWQMRDFVLYCNARFDNGTALDPSLYSKSYIYVWTKNDVYLDARHSTIKPDIVSEVNVWAFTNESSQGHYKCGLKVLPSGKTFWSDEVTVILRDFYTRRLTIFARAESLPTQRWNLIGPSFAVSGNITRLLGVLQQQIYLIPWSSYNIEAPAFDKLSWSFFRADPGSADGSLVNISGFVYVKQNANAETGLELRFPPLPNNPTGSWKVTLHDVVNCPPENGTRLQWTNYNHISAESSVPMCLTESGQLVPRRCLVNFTSEASWAPFDESRCVHLQQDPVAGKQVLRAICHEGPCLADLSSIKATWKNARDKCRSWNGYLASPSILKQLRRKEYGARVSPRALGGWIDITRKHGYIQSESVADDDALAALSRSEVWASHIVSSASSDPCFTVLQPQDRVVHHACHMHLKIPCVLPYRNGLLSLASCPKGGWLDFDSRSRCLWLNYTKLTQEDANSACESHGGRLAAFKGKHTYDTITAILAGPDVPIEMDTFWISLTKLNKTFRSKHTNWDPSSDYSKTGGTLRVNRYVAERPLEVKWSTAQPWMQYPFICEAPLVAGTPWLRVAMDQTGDAVTLTCHASPEIIEGSIMWFKDGLAVRGNRIELNPDSITLAIRGATKSSPYLQGYYWCEGISVDGFREVESRKRLLRLSGLETFIGSMEVTNTAINPDLTDLSSESFINFARNFLPLILGSQRMRRVQSYFLSDAMVISLKKLRYNTHRVHFAMYLNKPRFQVRKQRITARDLGEEAVADRDLGVHLRDALNTLNETSVMEFSLIPGTAQVFSTRLCSAATTNHSTGLHPTLHWPTTIVGDVATSDEACINGDNKPVVRRCQGNFSVGAYWGDVQGSCSLPPSQRTLDLKDLSQVIVTNDNALSTVVQLNNLTSDSERLMPQDVSYAAKTLENAASIQKISKQVAQNMITSINKIVNASMTSLLLSRAANSTNKIISSMEQMAANLQDHIVVFNGSTAMGKIPAQEYWTGIYLDTVEQQWRNFSKKPTDNADVAIMFPENNPCTIGVENANVTLGLLSHNALFGNSSNSTDEMCTAVLLVQYEQCKVENWDENFSFYFKDKCSNRTNQTQLSVECVFWDMEADNRMGAWSSAGCSYIGMTGKHHVCSCSHLTSFGVLFKYKNRPEQNVYHERILSFLTLIGITLSVVGLLLVVATYILSETWRKGAGHKCLLHLSISLLGSLVLFGVLVVSHNALRSSAACAVMGALLHYLLLVTFGWTFVEAMLQYLRFVKVLGTYIPRFVLKCALPAWGVPLIVVATMLSLDPHHYSNRRELCWPHGRPLVYGFILPVGLTLGANVAVFSVVIYNIYCRRHKALRSNQSQVKLAKAQLRATILIVFLLGLTWIFAYLSIIDAYGVSRVFEYLFVVSASLQGFVIFLFHVAYEQTARRLWRSKFVYWIPRMPGEIRGRRLHSDEGSSSTAQKTTST
ncbi:uncharacterized protein LOC135368170 [Ornithodoros turicata]|uniref:uncharacterized protein LOC135368170 n=1 Tax=Ornithodoros turicata TaxID=34597 RepID=UPI003139C054